MNIAVCLFEDSNYKDLLPLVYLRPVFELRVGILTVREKYQNMHPELKYIFHTRKYLRENYKEKNPNYLINNVNGDFERIYFINSRMVPKKEIFEYLLKLTPGMILKNKEKEIVAACLQKDIKTFGSLMDNEFLAFESLSGLKYETVDAPTFKYPWDLVNANGSEIVKDYELLNEEEPEKISGRIYEGVHILNRENVFIAPTARVKPGVVLDAEFGPIYIDEGALIMPNAVIEGPAYIGRNSTIKIGAKIYENTSIGKVCKVGGEVEESIIHSYSNKQHEGFLGHAYLCQWVNLGADTNNSDLKNNYSNVKAIINDELIDTGSTFVGLIMGDHSKTGINTMFNTATVVGVGCNIYGSGFPPKYIPSFSWGGSESLSTYRPVKFAEAAQKVMARRNIILTESDRNLFKHVFELTKNERLKRDMQG